MKRNEYGVWYSPRVVEPILAALIFLALAILLQKLVGAFSNDFGASSDDAAHFVSAVMVRDFLISGEFSRPIAFAKTFYLHYPKVAIGQWPPFLYLVLGGWMVVVGKSRIAALALVAIAAAATTTLIYLIGRPRIGRSPALMAALVFLLSPLVQQSTAQVMTEHFVTLLMLASALQFARYTSTGRTYDSLLFGVLAAMAILTHGNAWALALVPGLAILLTRRFDLLRRLSLWLSVIPVLITCVPWYLVTTRGIVTSWAASSGASSYPMIAAPFYARAMWQAVGLTVVVMAVVGVWAAVIRPWRSRAVDPVWATLAALMVATLILHCVVPTGLASRFMVAVIPEVVLFAAYGIAWLASAVAGFSVRLNWSVVLSLLVALAFLTDTFMLARIPLRFVGFKGPTRLLLAQSAATSPAFLVISDEKGEGAVVAEAALDQKWPGSFVLRGSKLLVHEDWQGRNTKDRFPSLEELARVLNKIPVSGILLDGSIPPDRREPFQERVRNLVVANPQIWERIASASVDRQGRVFANAVEVYLRRPVSGALPQRVNQDLLRRLIFDNLNR